MGTFRKRRDKTQGGVCAQGAGKPWGAILAACPLSPPAWWPWSGGAAWRLTLGALPHPFTRGQETGTDHRGTGRKGCAVPAAQSLQSDREDVSVSSV